MSTSNRFGGVRVRVTAAATLVALVVAALGAILFVRSLRSALEGQLLDASSQQLQGVQTRLKAGEGPKQAVVTGKGDDILVQILDPDGSVVASDHPRVGDAAAREPGTATGVRVRGLEHPYVVVAARERGGERLIVVGGATEGLDEATNTAGTLLAVSVPVGIGLLAVVVWLSVGRALRPVEQMRREASQITASRLGSRLEVPPGADEIPLLAQTLNDMLDRIDEAQRLQRQFVSDASHELRSPLASVRQSAEVARDYPDRTDTRQLAQEVLAEETRMEDLVGALLQLARLDDAAQTESGPVDLDDLVMEEVGRIRRSDTTACTIDVSGVGAAQVDGQALLLGQVVRNLLSNAIRHTSTTVQVLLAEEAGVAVLWVQDDGNGVQVGDRERIFERFVRLDESRSREKGGSGLGLAIVARIVRNLGGTVEVTDSAMGGARFIVTLPLSTSVDRRS